MTFYFCSGNFTIDEKILESQGVEDFSKYSATPGNLSLIPGTLNIVLLYLTILPIYIKTFSLMTITASLLQRQNRSYKLNK